MLNRQYFSIIWLVTMALVSCARPASPSPVPQATLTSPSIDTPFPKTPTLKPLATPYAQEPAAGICAQAEGLTAEIQLQPGVPDPRCLEVRADQLLVLTNHSDQAFHISLGSFSADIQPGESIKLEQPFGKLLAPGVHQIEATPCCGPEIWLKRR